MTESSATCTVDPEGMCLLHPSARTLAHLADTIRGCQDALSGYQDDDDASMATTSEAGCMSMQAAADGVRACFSAVVIRAFSKPIPLTKHAHGGNREAAWSLQTVKEAKKRLCERLQKLVSQLEQEEQDRAESIFVPTPNRVSNNTTLSLKRLQ